MLGKFPGERKAGNLVVLPGQVGSDRQRELGNPPKEVLIARGRLGAPALLKAILVDLEHALDVALDFSVDCAGERP